MAAVIGSTCNELSGGIVMPQASLQEIENGVYTHVGPDGESNRSIVATREGSILIDNYIRYQESLSECLEQVGGSAVRFVINTHSDMDHFSANQYFRRQGAVIMATAASRARIETMMATDYWVNELKARNPALAHELSDPRETIPHLTIDGKSTLTLGGEDVECIPMGHGHCPGDMVVYLRSRRVLFAGDLVFAGQHGRLKTADLDGLVTCLDRLLTLPVNTVIPGHGEPVIGQGTETIAIYRDYVVTLRREVERMLTAGSSLDEIKGRLENWKYADWGRQHLFPVCVDHVYKDVMWRRRFRLE
jgi:glyoxylase-like metal-dependent hydrolase (beta-lactamase superfamily II)